MLRSAGFAILHHPEEEVYICKRQETRSAPESMYGGDLGLPVEAIMIWNEPNNKSHWDFELDPDWQIFSKMVMLRPIAYRR